MAHILDTPITFLKGVGEQRAELLKKELGIFNFRDLLFYFPFRYVDKSRFFKVSDISNESTYYLLKGRIKQTQVIGERQHARLTAIFYDDTSAIELTWFKGIKWLKDFLKPHTDYVIFGKAKEFRGSFSMVHPEMEVYEDEKANTITLEPVYNSTEKLKRFFLDSKGIKKLCLQLFEKIEGHIDEVLSDELINKTKLIHRAKAIRAMHFPTSWEEQHLAHRRLVFEEFFFFSLKLLLTKNYRNTYVKGFVFDTVGDFLNTFYKECLPFSLTEAQKRVVKEMRKDMHTGKQMNRLLQGDVGSGKTLVALMLMLIAVDNGFQACLMVPTEILAQQHFNSFTKFLEKLNINVALLTGSTKASVRKKLHQDLLSGNIRLLIGTHALIESTVQFNNLGLVVIDEQHRFGVAQRAKLWKKNNMPPHVLVMTATPIPRTLAMSVYGDLDVSVIDELPPGRKPIKTYHVTETARSKVFGFMRNAIKSGRQVYVVYPLIEESELLDLNNLTEGFESMSRAFPLPEYAVSMVHGRMKASEKEYEMKRFIKGETNIMVATTVIEVGVDVPNATIMLIENAERFGLAQLHQLRGRVGRGAADSYCILLTSDKLSDDGKKRIEAMVSTSDGFKIAELDLKLRGAGDIQGLKQSGVPDFKIADIYADQQLLIFAKNMAEFITQDDPLLENDTHKCIKKHLISLSADKGQWDRIS